MKNLKNIKVKYLVAPIMLITVLVITIVNAAFNQTMLITGTGWARVSRDVRITGVTRDSSTNGGYSTYNPKYSEISVTLSDTLPNLNSTVTYKIEIKNNTSYFINVSDVTSQVTNPISNPSVTYEFDKSSLSSTYGSQLINPNSTAYVYVTIKYKSGVSLPNDTTNTALLKFKFGPLYAEDLSYSNSTYTTCTDVQCALDDISDILTRQPPICIRATIPHTEECTYTSGTNNCRKSGYYSGGSKNTTTITYGNIKASGTPIETGDAFDCDVNGDEVYDPLTERFYYVSDYWNMPSTGEDTFDSSTAVLIYYSGVKNVDTVSTPTYDRIKYYETSNTNYNGPVTASAQLPLATTWSNVTLKDSTRQIYNQANGILYSVQYPVFDYSNYAGRLVTYQEIYNGCYEEGNTITSSNGLRNCEFLFENSRFANSSYINYGPLFETPRSGTDTLVYYAYSQSLYIGSTNSNNLYCTVKPVIEVPKARIQS